MTLTEFLLARIAEDEANIAVPANQISPSTFDDYPDSGVEKHYCADNGPYYLTVGSRRLLAECEAKRRIVDEHPSAQYGHDGIAEACTRCSSWSREGLDDDAVLWPCDTLRALALPYADHSDYRSEWRP